MPRSADLAFDDILTECADQLLDCTIPADRIRVAITQDVVYRLIELHSEWAESAPISSYSVSTQTSGQSDGNAILSITVEADDNNQSDISIEAIETFFQTLLNKEVVLGETHYSQLDGSPYDHEIQTTIIRGADQSDDFSFPVWQDEDFSATWHEDSSVAKFSTNTEQSTHTYFYQDNIPSELVVSHLIFSFDDDGSETAHYAKIFGNDPNQAGVLLEAATSSAAFSGSSFEEEPTVEQAYGVFQGQWDNLIYSRRI